MALGLQILLIAASVLVTFYTISKIRRARLDIDDALFWIFFSLILLVMSIFPIIPTFFAELIGIQSPVNFVFLFMIFIAFIKLFNVAVELSVQKHRLNSLVQRLAIDEAERKEKEKEKEKENSNDQQ